MALRRGATLQMKKALKIEGAEGNGDICSTQDEILL